VRDLDDALRAAGKAFNEVKDELTAAYDETIVPSPDEARDCTAGGADEKLGGAPRHHGLPARSAPDWHAALPHF
jgi:hypothetical protein